MKANVLVVDDDDSIRRALAERIRHWGHLADEARDGDEALDIASRKEYDVIFLDLAMPGRGGMEVLRSWSEAGYGADVIVLTAQGSVDAAVEAIRMGAADFLQKPADFGLLEAAVNRLLSKRQLVRVNQALADQIGETNGIVLSTARSMTDLLEVASRAAQGNATILLTGESGSGKQMLAEYIHQRSPRQKGPFVYVNCVALSDELIESTLFGHERGAFTGAIARKDGRLEAAGGGTAFLDEVGDITPRLQAKLLHFLEAGEFERVGGTRTIHVDCRVIAATNRNLESAVKEAKFREDLYFRLNVIGLRVPPLRERDADIPLLAEAFLTRFASELGRGKLKLAARTTEILRRYPWPGNVRQLKNAIERMAVLARTDTLTSDLLPPEVLASDQHSEHEPEDLPIKEAMHAFKKRYIANALARAGGNQRIAAERLGLQRTFLNRMIKEYGL
ncbi:MAG: sigma-54-dependent Fis family transcriptional regulator [Candidatus Eisenbacteria bacterium]|uniref:Sigma-54-dependent Fis family transcriptional regulator n=1 Tax=Eiseniibacteriota bacterium TaxID=2212470 RepID=A0A538TN70_UNCEI|nr:MAG: sigma-54-dependent Fis family transcriptional regulator [Candidatus Eisenbacteria bacterium]TMQ65063.1 MAG: sigma-54-dependent Fis family transcriptional regulator [Candidatus Eisenbacteria bacterium]